MMMMCECASANQRSLRDRRTDVRRPTQTSLLAATGAEGSRAETHPRVRESPGAGELSR